MKAKTHCFTLLLLVLFTVEAGAADNRFYMSAVVEPPIIGIKAGGIDANYLLLLPDGTAYRGIPDNGAILTASAADLRGQNAKRLGRYRQRGNRLTVEWAVGKPWTLTAAGDGWQHKQRRYYRVQPVGRRVLNGLFSTTMGGVPVGMPGSTPVVSMSRTRSMVFFPDGRFLRSHKVFASGSDSSQGGSFVGKQDGSGGGHYTIDGFTLTLHHDSGAQTRHAIFYWPDWDQALGIDYGMYQYQGTAPAQTSEPRQPTAPQPATPPPAFEPYQHGDFTLMVPVGWAVQGNSQTVLVLNQDPGNPLATRILLQHAPAAVAQNPQLLVTMLGQQFGQLEIGRLQTLPDKLGQAALFQSKEQPLAGALLIKTGRDGNALVAILIGAKQGFQPLPSVKLLAAVTQNG